MFWGGPFSRNEFAGSYELVGDRLGFVAGSEGISNGAGTSIGWIGLPSGPEKLKTIFEREEVAEEDEPGPKIPSEDIRLALGADGSIALAGEAVDRKAEAEHPEQTPPHEWEVALLTFKAGQLSHPKRLLKTDSAAEAPVLSSVAISASTVSWRNGTGAAVSVPRL
jgi:hypothetical protein